MVLYGLNTGKQCLVGVFVFTFLHGNISFFYTVSACLKDYDFGTTEFVLPVYIVASVVVSILSLLLLILSLLLFVLVLLLLFLSLH